MIYVPGFVLIITSLSFLGWLLVIVAKPEEEWQREYHSEYVPE